MSDWLDIAIPDLDTAVAGDAELDLLADELVLERLPHAFDTKRNYLQWRIGLASGLDLDPSCLRLVGSAATGRSLNPANRYKVFGTKSDLDIAVVSNAHFDIAWSWLRTADPLFVSGGPFVEELIDSHRKHYIYDGVITANSFLSYLPFGTAWSQAMVRSQADLPDNLQGRPMSMRIYRDHHSLRLAVVESLRKYRLYLHADTEDQAND